MVEAQNLRAKDRRVPIARRLRRNMTEAERRLWYRLRQMNAAGSHFRRQATIGPFFVDFACHRSRLVIEVDGGQHGEQMQAGIDAERTNLLAEQGYRVLRFWNNDVLSNIEGVLTIIQEALRSPLPPTPDPSPPQAGGGEPRGLA